MVVRQGTLLWIKDGRRANSGSVFEHFKQLIDGKIVIYYIVQSCLSTSIRQPVPVGRRGIGCATTCPLLRPLRPMHYTKGRGSLYELLRDRLAATKFQLDDASACCKVSVGAGTVQGV